MTINTFHGVFPVPPAGLGQAPFVMYSPVGLGQTLIPPFVPAGPNPAMLQTPAPCHVPLSPLVPAATQWNSPHNTGAYFGPTQKKKNKAQKKKKKPQTQVSSQMPTTEKLSPKKKGFKLI